jgi:hypothetical protein
LHIYWNQVSDVTIWKTDNNEVPRLSKFVMPKFTYHLSSMFS